MTRENCADDGRLEEALLAALDQAKVELTRALATFEARIAGAKRITAEHSGRGDEWSERFEERCKRIEALVLENSRLARELPERICAALGL